MPILCFPLVILGSKYSIFSDKIHSKMASVDILFHWWEELIHFGLNSDYEIIFEEYLAHLWQSNPYFWNLFRNQYWIGENGRNWTKMATNDICSLHFHNHYICWYFKWSFMPKYSSFNIKYPKWNYFSMRFPRKSAKFWLQIY